MLNRTSSLILIIVICASIYVIYEAFHVPEKSLGAEEVTLTQPHQPAVVQAPTVRPVVAKKIETPAQSTPKENGQIEDMREQLSAQAQVLQRLRKSQAEQSIQLNSINPQQMSQNLNQIQNLSDLLTNARLAESDVNRAVRSAQIAQSSNEKFIRDQLDFKIQLLSENIRQAKNNMNDFPPAEIVTGIQKENYYANLQKNLAIQIEQLRDLRQQKLDHSAAAAYQTVQIQTLAEYERANLVEEQSAIQRQIFNLRDELRNRQDTNNQLRMSLVPIEQQIEQAQRDYETLQKKISVLESKKSNSVH